MRARVVFLLLLLALLVPLRAGADAHSSSARHFRRANQLFKAARYDQALAEYLAAYEQAPQPTLLFNIAQTYRLRGDKLKANEYYERFLMAQPNGPGSDKARTFRDQLRDEMAADNRPPSAEKTRSEPVAEETSVRRREILSESEILRSSPERQSMAEGARTGPDRASSDEARKLVPSKSGERDESGSSSTIFKVSGAVAAAAGFGLIVAGIAQAISAQNQADAITNTSEWTDTDVRNLPDTLRAGEDTARTAYILFAAGGGLMVTGAILYYLGLRHNDSAPVSVAPAIAPGTAGLTAVGRF